MCPIINGVPDEDLDLLNAFSAMFKNDNSQKNTKKEIFVSAEEFNQNALSAVEILNLQRQANQMATTILNSPQAARGEFKLVVPLNEQYAIAIACNSKGTQEENKKMLKQEGAYLEVLSQLGFPAIRFHGDIFEFGPQKYAAVIIDRQPHELLIEGKHPDAVKTILPAMLLGVKIPKGEGWVMQYDSICQQMDFNILHKVVTLSSVKEKIARLLKSFSEFTKRLDLSQIKIADLQILIDDHQQLRIIDPLAVFFIHETNINEYVDALDKTPTRFDFSLSQSLANTTQMLSNIQTWLIFASKVESLKEIRDLFTSTPKIEEKPKKVSSGMSPLFREFLKPKIDFKVMITEKCEIDCPSESVIPNKNDVSNLVISSNKTFSGVSDLSSMEPEEQTEPLSLEYNKKPSNKPTVKLRQ